MTTTALMRVATACPVEDLTRLSMANELRPNGNGAPAALGAYIRLPSTMREWTMSGNGQTQAADSSRLPATTPARTPAVRREGAVAIGATAIGALALGALAVGAIASGKLAIGQLVLGRARLRKGQVDELRITRLTIGELRVERVSGKR
jgi:hypothetical protein